VPDENAMPRENEIGFAASGGFATGILRITALYL
jgi:hypothetical protein